MNLNKLAKHMWHNTLGESFVKGKLIMVKFAPRRFYKMIYIRIRKSITIYKRRSVPLLFSKKKMSAFS